MVITPKDNNDAKQLNLSLSEDEWTQIDSMSRKLGIEKKELVIKALSGLKEETRSFKDESDSQMWEEVQECMKLADGFFGFRLESLIKEFENRGLTWPDLGEFDQLAILIRYRDHARFWHYSGEQMRLELSELASRTGGNVNQMLRTLHTTLTEKNRPKSSTPTILSVLPPIVRAGEEADEEEEQDDTKESTEDDSEPPKKVRRDTGRREVQEAP